jgi:hypothetical protein
MYTIYDFMNKFQYDKFSISVNGEKSFNGKQFCFSELKDAIEYGESLEDKALDLLSEEGVAKVDFMTMTIYVVR